MPTEQQEMFEAICRVFGWRTNELTPTARTRIGKVAKELREAGATPAMVAWSPQAWDRMWGDDVPTLTDTALAAHWPEIAKRWRRREASLARRRSEDELLAVDEAELLPLEENRRRLRALIAGLGKSKLRDLLRDVTGGPPM